MKAKFFTFLIVAVIALGGGIFVQRMTKTNGTAVNDPLPELSLPDLAGKTRHLSDWKGKILVVNFWATWCPPCREEIPEFIALQKKYGAQGLQFIGIALEDRQPVADYLSKIDINYPNLIAGDNGSALSVQFGNIIGAVPFTIIADKSGHIVERHPGEMDRRQLEKIIVPLLSD